MKLRFVGFASCALGVCAALACGGGGDGGTGTTGVVQLVGITTNTLTISCGNLNHLANPDSIYINAHMVNTSAANVSIDSIGSNGYVSRASDQAVVGQGALNFTSLPFNPRPATLQAHTGDLTLVVSLSTNALCAASSIQLQYKDVMTSIRVTTSAGQYVSVPVSVHVNYVGGLLRAG